MHRYTISNGQILLFTLLNFMFDGFYSRIIFDCFGDVFVSAGIGWNLLFNKTQYIFLSFRYYVFGLLVNLFMILSNFYLIPSYNGIGETLNEYL